MDQDMEAPMALMDESFDSPSKREGSPSGVPATKKVRGERISSKDFIPPDVSGLTKREARLVKNRAAAFLSRQRKREEFETMEIRVGELEEENARLLALTQGSMANANTSAEPHSQGSTSPALSEIEQLRAQLAAAQERERQLCATIAAVSTSTAAVAPAVARAIKAEETPIVLPPAPPAPPSLISRSSFPSPSSAIKSGTGLGLMVLLCALPNILSMTNHHQHSNQHSMPTSSFSSAFESALPLSPTSGFDMNSFIAQDHDWSRGNIMDLDLDDQHHDLFMDLPSSTTAFTPADAAPASAQSPQSAASKASASPQKLHISNSQLPGPLNNIQGLDISFDAVPGEDGKITVRILPPGQANGSTGDSSSRASSVAASSPSPWTADSAPTSGPITTFPEFVSSPASVPNSSHGLKDPFLGVGDNLDSVMGGDYYGLGKWNQGYHAQGDVGDDLGSVFEMGSDCGASLDSWGASSAGAGGKRRVRVTLKSLPSDETGEGGEWELQFC